MNPSKNLELQVKDNKIILGASAESNKQHIIDKLSSDGFKPFGTSAKEFYSAQANLLKDEGKISELPLEPGYCVVVVNYYHDIYYWTTKDTIEEAKESCINYLAWASFGSIVYISQNLHCFGKTFSETVGDVVSSEQLQDITGF